MVTQGQENFDFRLSKDAKEDGQLGKLIISHLEAESPLIKAVVSNLPIYYRPIFKISKKITQELESLAKQFSWKGKCHFKYHLIKWGIVSQPKKEGGLGTGGILKRNTAHWEMDLEFPFRTIHSLGFYQQE